MRRASELDDEQEIERMFQARLIRRGTTWAYPLIVAPVCLDVTAVCTECGSENQIRVNTDEFKAWLKGVNVQRAFPAMPAHLRELFVSGLCGDCWDRLMKPDDEDEEEELQDA